MGGKKGEVIAVSYLCNLTTPVDTVSVHGGCQLRKTNSETQTQLSNLRTFTFSSVRLVFHSYQNVFGVLFQQKHTLIKFLYAIKMRPKDVNSIQNDAALSG